MKSIEFLQNIDKFCIFVKIAQKASHINFKLVDMA